MIWRTDDARISIDDLDTVSRAPARGLGRGARSPPRRRADPLRHRAAAGAREGPRYVGAVLPLSRARGVTPVRLRDGVVDRGVPEARPRGSLRHLVGQPADVYPGEQAARV